VRNPVLVALGLLACSPGESKHQDSPQVAREAPIDSLVLVLPDSGEIWFTASMLDTAATGETCRTRTLEIRRGASRTPVPLLYTMGTLELVNDTTVRAALVRDCVKHDTYLVNTKTGQPRRPE
jgi:hypothetical protein